MTTMSRSPQCPEDASLGDVIDALSACDGDLFRTPSDTHCTRALPSRDAVVEAVELLRSVLFPGFFGHSDVTDETSRYYVGVTLDRVRRILAEQVRRGLCFTGESPLPADAEARADRIVRTFLQQLPEVRRLLLTDIQAAYEGDPAATSREETLFCYPGLLAIISQRIAHELHLLGVPLLPRMITEHAHSITGIDIHPGASIGEAFFIDHGTGVVIGETCEIGRNVRLYQGVTLGAKSFPLDEHGNPIKGIARHPIVEDDVIIYAGATILGRIVIGRGASIGGNVWVTEAVPAGCRVVQNQAHQVHSPRPD